MLFTLPALYAIVSSIAISSLALVGSVFFLLRESIMKKLLMYMVSFSTGAILGDVFLHILAEIAEDSPETFASALIILLLGIVFSFGLEKVIRWRHCHVLPTANHEHCHHIGVLNLVGDGIHNFIDGVVIAVAFLASVPIGISTTIAVALHELPHEMGDVAMLLHCGYKKSRVLLFNLLSGITALVGTVSVLLLTQKVEVAGEYLLPFAAGNLLYIAAADLIPELHKETRIVSGILQLAFMVLGIAVMIGLLHLE